MRSLRRGWRRMLGLAMSAGMSLRWIGSSNNGSRKVVETRWGGGDDGRIADKLFLVFEAQGGSYRSNRIDMERALGPMMLVPVACLFFSVPWFVEHEGRHLIEYI